MTSVLFEKFVENITEVISIYADWLDALRKECKKHKDNTDKLITLQKRFTEINTLYMKLEDLLEYCADNHDIDFYEY